MNGSEKVWVFVKNADEWSTKQNKRPDCALVG